MNRDDAKKLLIKNMESEARLEAARMVKDIKDDARRQGDKEAKEILTLAIQRCAADHVVESTVSVVNLPSDEMKGRIIGREGRNIRAFETRHRASTSSWTTRPRRSSSRGSTRCGARSRGSRSNG